MRKQIPALDALPDAMRLPFIKRARAKGNVYYYFRCLRPTGTDGTLVRLPDPSEEHFAEAYAALYAKVYGGEEAPVTRSARFSTAAGVREHTRFLRGTAAVAARATQAAGEMARRDAVIGGRPQLVYFIGGEVGMIKIGLAADPEARRRRLQTGSPIPLRVLATAPGGRAQEAAYHAAFRGSRAHGEWFERSPEIEAEIARLSVSA